MGCRTPGEVSEVTREGQAPESNCDLEMGSKEALASSPRVLLAHSSDVRRRGVRWPPGWNEHGVHCQVCHGVASRGLMTILKLHFRI